MLTGAQVFNLKQTALEDAYAPGYFRLINNNRFQTLVGIILCGLYSARLWYELGVMFCGLIAVRIIVPLWVNSHDWEYISVMRYNRILIPGEYSDYVLASLAGEIQLFVERDRKRRTNIVFLLVLNPETGEQGYLGFWENPKENKLLPGAPIE